MSLSTYFLEYGRHVVQLRRRRRRRRRAYAPRAIPLAMITMRKSTHGFLFPSYMSIGLRLGALWAVGAPLLDWFQNSHSTKFISIGNQMISSAIWDKQAQAKIS